MSFSKRTLPELEPGDRALAERMLSGDAQAFESFFEGHFPGLYRFALARTKDPELARDLSQSAICKAIANLRSYRGEASLAGWLFTICRYEISAHFKRHRRRPEAVELNEEVVDSDRAYGAFPGAFPDPEEALRDKEVAQRVHATLDRLPPRYGQALEWKYVDGLSVETIAERLEVGPKAAESILSRARRAFKDGFAAIGRSLDSATPIHDSEMVIRS